MFSAGYCMDSFNCLPVFFNMNRFAFLKTIQRPALKE